LSTKADGLHWLSFTGHISTEQSMYSERNFGRVHQSLRATPAMEAGIANDTWEIGEIIALLN
jgi:hypothetical protein